MSVIFTELAPLARGVKGNISISHKRRRRAESTVENIHCQTRYIKKGEEKSVKPLDFGSKKINGAFVDVCFHNWCISLLQSHIRDMVVLFYAYSQVCQDQGKNSLCLTFLSPKLCVETNRQALGPHHAPGSLIDSGLPD